MEREHKLKHKSINETVSESKRDENHKWEFNEPPRCENIKSMFCLMLESCEHA